MRTDHSTRELDALLGALCEGSLDDAGAARLNAILGGSRAARGRYLLYMEVHGALHWDHATEAGDALEQPGAAARHTDLHPTPSAPAFADPASVEHGVAATTDTRDRTPNASAPAEPFRMPGSPTPVRHPAWRSAGRGRSVVTSALLGLAASVLFLAGVWTMSGLAGNQGAPAPLGGGDDRPPATLVAQAEARWHGRALAGGTRLRAGESFVLADGAARLRFADGTDVIVEGPASFRVEAPARVALDAGRLSAASPPSVTGFTVRTPDASVVDLGTEFGVRAGPAGTRVHVYEGRVDVNPAGASRPGLGEAYVTRPSTPVAAGRTATVAPGATAVSVDADGAAPAAGGALGEFVRIKDFESLARAATPAAPAADRAAALWFRLHRDPALIAYYAFAEDDRSAGALVNRAGPAGAAKSPPARPGPVAAAVTADWAAGRFDGKPALAFADSADRAAVRVPGRHARLTLAAWVNVADLAPVDPAGRRHAFWSSLLMTDGRGAARDGYVHWQVSSVGRLSLSASQTRQPQPNYEGGPVGVVTSGAWHHVAVTYDSVDDRVAFYVDGRRTHAEPTAGQGPLEVGDAQVGNWADDDGLTRHLAGRVDELVVLSRAMTADEVAALWRMGRPAE